MNELELVESQPITDLEITRPPDVVLQEAKQAADALKDVISKKARPVIFNGEQYLEFEDWQTIGRFYGVTVKIAATRPVSFGDVRGFEADAIVLHTGSGREVSRAEAMCLNDERNWKDKPLFQLRSMAQTRAGSKALRNVLAWVVVLAGYKPTPAEEMDGVFKDKPNIPHVRPRKPETQIPPATDKYTGEPIKQEDGAGEVKSSVDGGPRLARQGSNLPQTTDLPPAQQASDAPAPISVADHARQLAESHQADYDTVEGHVVNVQPYGGTKRNQKGKRPGQFDVEDEAGQIVTRGIRYFDPDLDITSGKKLITYKIGEFRGQEQLTAEEIVDAG